MPFTGRLRAWSTARGAGRGGYLSTAALGAVYGLAGFCSGPVLGAILMLAATQDSPLRGGVLLAAYAVGMALPLFVLAWFWDRYELGRRAWLRGRELALGPVRLHTTNLVAGLLFVAIGALFLRFDGTAGITGVLGLGDTTDLEVRAQELVTRLATAIPAWALPAAVAILAGTIAWSRMRRTDIPPREPAAAPEPAEQDRRP
ncbi:cytochrome c biogenesis CcdA family protein [Segeticoccus rhizosphaerae]